MSAVGQLLWKRMVSRSQSCVGRLANRLVKSADVILENTLAETQKIVIGLQKTTEKSALGVAKIQGPTACISSPISAPSRSSFVSKPSLWRYNMHENLHPGSYVRRVGHSERLDSRRFCQRNFSTSRTILAQHDLSESDLAHMAAQRRTSHLHLLKSHSIFPISSRRAWHFDTFWWFFSWFL